MKHDKRITKKPLLTHTSSHEIVRLFVASVTRIAAPGVARLRQRRDGRVTAGLRLAVVRPDAPGRMWGRFSEAAPSPFSAARWPFCGIA